MSEVHAYAGAGLVARAADSGTNSRGCQSWPSGARATANGILRDR